MTNVSPWIVTPPTVAVATPSTGFSRTVTVELLLMRSPSVLARYGSVPLSDTNVQCYEKTTARGNPAILPPSTEDDPGGYAKWVRSPHGPATVSGYAAPGSWLRSWSRAR